MYLGRVNRGISFTKAGTYTTGLVVLLGFLATGSGYNGLFLSLGFGLSFLIISGLLSEKTIQAATIDDISEVSADAGESFAVCFQITNRSRHWFVFSLECLATEKLPRFRLLQPEIDAAIDARLFALAPGQTVSVPGRAKGMRRGWYKRFYVIQRTLFPFGMISKFKVGTLPASVSILPARDPALGKTLDEELARQLSGRIRQDEQEFHSHRQAAAHAPRQLLDLKKNAGRPHEAWVMKVFESRQSQTGFRISPDWSALSAAASESAYEHFFSRVRTAVDAIHRAGRPLVLELPDGSFVVGHEDALTALVRAPRFEERGAGWPPGGDLPQGEFQRLDLSSGGHGWRSVPGREAV